MKTNSQTKNKSGLRFVAAGIVASAALTLAAAEHNVPSGTASAAGLSEADRFVKTGEGELVLSGANTLSAGMQTSAGTLRINGGTTAVSGTGGASADTAAFSQSGGTTIVEGGATINVTGSGYSGNFGGDLLVTNGTFDITSGTTTSGKEFLNAFNRGTDENPQAARLVVQDKGVFKAETLRISQNHFEALKDGCGVFLNAGGKIYVDKLSYDNASMGSLYGSIRYNGGELHFTGSGGSVFNFNAGNASTIKSYVDEGGLYVVNDASSQISLDWPLYGGAGQDGGVHYSYGSGKSKYIRLFASSDNTFNGGSWLDDNVILVNYMKDGAFGAVPDTPEDNIFFKASGAVLFNGNVYTLHRNRNIVLDAGVAAGFASTQSAGARIGGRIRVPDGTGSTTNTQVVISGDWSGRTVFDTGAGRTNLLDRLRVDGWLEVASGVTSVRAPTRQGVNDNSPLYVVGNTAYGSGNKGQLLVSGGELLVQPGQYVVAGKYAQVSVTGGTFRAASDIEGGYLSEYINGLSDKCCAILTVAGTGVFNLFRTRVSQSWSVPSEININTGGVLRTGYLYMANTSQGAVNLNGGTIAAYTNPDISLAEDYRYNFLGGHHEHFIGTGATAGSYSNNWTNVVVRVKEGGARFKTEGAYSYCVNMPLNSDVADDGGITKSGEGVLTLTKTNFYNGVTRLDGGKLVFEAEHGLPAKHGDIEFTAAALESCTGDGNPLLVAERDALDFRSGCGLRVSDAEKLVVSKNRRWRTVATFAEPIGLSTPLAATYVTNGVVAASEKTVWKGMYFRVDPQNDKALQFGYLRGLLVVVQ